MGHVVLLYPHHGRNRSQEFILPLSLLYLVAPLTAQGHDVTVIDQRTQPDWRERLGQAINAPRTVAAGISSMTGPQIAHGIEMARAIRAMAPNLPIVWGGVHPSLLPEQTARSPFVDIVVIGEGETCFPPLVNALDQRTDWRGLPGLCYVENERVVRNPSPPPADLETFPPLPYDVFDIEKYRVSPLRSRRPSLPMATSRGCRFRCAYCYNPGFSGRTWRGWSPERTMAEIRRLAEQYDTRDVFLLDDNFFQDLERAREIMRLVVESRLGTRIYNANCRIDLLNRMTDEDLLTMKRAGIEQLFIGVESGSPAMLKAMQKDITLQQVIAVNKKIRGSGVIPVYSFMAGLPEETRSDVEKTLDLMMQLKKDNSKARFYKMALYLPFPGTAFYEQCVAMGNVFPQRLEDWADYDYDHININHLTEEYRRFLADVTQLSGFLDVTDKIKGPMSIVAQAYSKVAALRCRRRWFGWMPEMALVRRIRSWQRT